MKIKHNCRANPNQKIHVIHVQHVQHLGHHDHFGDFGNFGTFFSIFLNFFHLTKLHFRQNAIKTSTLQCIILD